VSLVSGGLADSRVKFSSDIPCRTDIRELIVGTLRDFVEATLVDDDELLIDGDRGVEVAGLVVELDVFCRHAVRGHCCGQLILQGCKTRNQNDNCVLQVNLH